MNVSKKETERRVAEELRNTIKQNDPIKNKLETNEQVIARITDGIYRQPGSALRELIINAYDADATSVSVKTDAPEFSQITIEDNGKGMTTDTVVHLLNNIGGSAKRTDDGRDLGITSGLDRTLSPGGRKLIGKLGIGLFSVSQLTYSFQIVTKVRGDNYRTVVLVRLKQFDDEPIENEDGTRETGVYQAWCEPSGDTDAQGTTIILNAIKPQTKNTLRSEQVWKSLSSDIEDENGPTYATPQYHIGYVGENGAFLLSHGSPVYPWEDETPNEQKFKSMVDSVWEQLGKSASAAKLGILFDEYFRMIWNLALALPLPYVEKNILDETTENEWAYFYKLSNSPKGSATELKPQNNETVRELAGLPRNNRHGLEFCVTVDGVELYRPIKFRNLPASGHILKKPMVFAGAVNEQFEGINRSINVGALEFEAYLFWTPKVAPTEHQGVLVRVHDSSGTLFDSTFFNYQVSELTRLRQIVCEIFVDKGLEAALNIDRESLNTAHPHTVYLARWIHSGLRQMATTQKRVSADARNKKRVQLQEHTQDRLEKITQTANEKYTGGEGVIPAIEFDSESNNEKVEPTEEIVQRFDLDHIIESVVTDRKNWTPKKDNVTKLKAIAKVLAIYDVFDPLNVYEQESLLGSILGVLEVDDLG